MHSTVFLDRDGVINRKPPEAGYVTRWEDLEILPGVASAIARLNHAALGVVVITNQRCIARGLITVPDLEAMHRRMLEELANAGAKVDAIYYCPHERDAGCGCRKPAPGMLLQAARERSIDLPSSWMIGDSEIDIQAGKAAGCRTVRLVHNGEAWQGTDVTASSLLDAVEIILRLQNS